MGAVWFITGTSSETSGDQIGSLYSVAVDFCTCLSDQTKHNTDSGLLLCLTHMEHRIGDKSQQIIYIMYGDVA